MSTAPITGPVAANTAARIRSAAPPAAAAAAVQGFYYLGTGLWPLANLESFLKVTGPKTDLWLVLAFGVLVAVAGVVFLVAAWRQKVPLEIVTLAVGLALALAGVDIVFVLRRDIGPVYLIDALATQIWAVTPGQMTVFKGSYQEYIAARDGKSSPAKDDGKDRKETKTPTKATSSNGSTKSGGRPALSAPPPSVAATGGHIHPARRE